MEERWPPLIHDKLQHMGASLRDAERFFAAKGRRRGIGHGRL